VLQWIPTLVEFDQQVVEFQSLLRGTTT